MTYLIYGASIMLAAFIVGWLIMGWFECGGDVSGN